MEGTDNYLSNLNRSINSGFDFKKSQNLNINSVNESRVGRFTVSNNQTENELLISHLKSQVAILKPYQKELEIMNLNHQKILYE